MSMQLHFLMAQITSILCSLLRLNFCQAHLVLRSHILKELYVVLCMELGHIWS